MNSSQNTHYMVLARKWRPKKFADIVGQQISTTILKNIIISKTPHHAYLLTGTRGVGKTTIARIIAKAFNCEHVINGEPCCQCDICVQVDNGRLVDVIEIDAASNTGVDNIRDLIDNARYAPTVSKYKVYIIDEVHMLSKAAFNAMLKTLEEPPAHVIFILATTDLHKIPITILSRCLQLKLRHLQVDEIVQHLQYIATQENTNLTKDALKIIAKAANGSMRDALSILDQAIAFGANQTNTINNNAIDRALIEQLLGVTSNELITNLLRHIINNNPQELLSIAKQIHNEGHDLQDTLSKLAHLLCTISEIQLLYSKQLLQHQSRVKYQSPTQLNAQPSKNATQDLTLDLTQLSSLADTATGVIDIEQLISNEDMLSLLKTISVLDIQLYFEICTLTIKQMAHMPDQYPIFIMGLLRMLAFTIGTKDTKTLSLQAHNLVINTTTNSKDAAVNKHTASTDTVVNVNTNNATHHIAAINEHRLNEKEPSRSFEMTQNVNEDTPSAPYVPSFDWLTMINAIKPQAATHLIPFLDNARLIHFREENQEPSSENMHTSTDAHTDTQANTHINTTTYLLQLAIDKRYQSSFKNNYLQAIKELITDYLYNAITNNTTAITNNNVQRDQEKSKANSRPIVQLQVEFMNNVTDGTIKHQKQQAVQQKQLDAQEAIDHDQHLLHILNTISATIVTGSIKPL